MSTNPQVEQPASTYSLLPGGPRVEVGPDRLADIRLLESLNVLLARARSISALLALAHETGDEDVFHTAGVIYDLLRQAEESVTAWCDAKKPAATDGEP